MSNNNTSKAKAILNDLVKTKDTEKLKLDIEHHLCEEYGDVMKEFTAEEIDNLASLVRDHVMLKPIVELTAEAVADKVLFNPTDTRWLADKAIDVLTTAVGVGGLMWATNKLGLGYTASRDPLPEASRLADSPFSDTAQASSTKVGRSRDNVVPFDRKAS